MLIQRLLTAMILIPLVVIALFFLPLDGFAFVAIVICGLGAWEWGQFLRLEKAIIKGVFAISMMLLLGIIYYCPAIYVYQHILFNALLVVAIVWWLTAFLLVIKYPNSANLWKNSLLIKAIFALLTLVPFFVGLVALRSLNYQNNTYTGAICLLYVLVLVWATDSGAYFVGRAKGKHKLAPNVSPGKTREGLFGGVLTAMIICVAAYFLYLFDVSFITFVLSSVAAILVSVLGDLVESMFKREAGIKDSGNLIPGHGGILDRIDSLTAAIPIFSALLYLL